VPLGAEHPDVANSLANLATVYHAMGDYAAAEPLLRQALAINRKALGEDHPNVALTLCNLTWLCVATGRGAEALELMTQAAVIDDGMIGQVFSLGSENQRMAYLRTLRGSFWGLMSLVLQYHSHSSTAVRAAFELVRRRKGLGTAALAVQRDAVLGGRYPALSPKLREWASLRL
jgi:tetratricopeptide (TPR) repeat protein